MEAKFKSLSLFEFESRFPDDDSCLEYLSNSKWQKGYLCAHCGHSKFCQGSKKYDRQCTRCRYLESPTAGTLFHKMKFSIRKAFYIVYFISTCKKGISSTELCRKLDLRQKTCWLFKQKVMQAMESTNRHPLEGEVEIRKFKLTTLKDSNKNTNESNKTHIVMGIEKKTIGVARVYGLSFRNMVHENIKNFVQNKISPDAHIKLNSISKVGNEKLFAINTNDIVKAKYGHMDRVIDGFKAWIKGIHGHVKYIGYYINEYCYRYNRHLMKEEIFEDLINRMVIHKPAPYKFIIA